MAGTLICENGVSVSQAAPNEITSTGYLIVHYLGEDPWAVGPGSDPWRPRFDEGFGAITPAPDFQMDFDPEAEALVCMRMGPSPGEPYLFVEHLDDGGGTIRVSAYEDGAFLDEVYVPVPSNSATELRIVKQSGAIYLLDGDGTPLVTVTAGDVADLFALSSAPFDTALMYPYAFSASPSGLGADAIRKVYYNGIGDGYSGFWTNFILSAETP